MTLNKEKLILDISESPKLWQMKFLGTLKKSSYQAYSLSF